MGEMSAILVVAVLMLVQPSVAQILTQQNIYYGTTGCTGNPASIGVSNVTTCPYPGCDPQGTQSTEYTCLTGTNFYSGIPAGTYFLFITQGSDSTCSTSSIVRLTANLVGACQVITPSPVIYSCSGPTNLTASYYNVSDTTCSGAIVSTQSLTTGCINGGSSGYSYYGCQTISAGGSGGTTPAPSQGGVNPGAPTSTPTQANGLNTTATATPTPHSAASLMNNPAAVLLCCLATLVVFMRN